jgi:LuxR family transcriptional regulator, positive regulator of biofilm formation
MSYIEPRFYVAGDNSFNNEVLADYLSRQNHLSCHSVQLSQLPYIGDPASESTVVLFYDCAFIDEKKLERETRFERFLQLQQCRVVCFNLDSDSHMDTIAFRRGIDGVIYDHQPIMHYTKAAEAVLNGELWYPRRILEQHLFDHKPAACISEPEASLLTSREREVLVMITSGKRNTDIAAKLCISPHTVKSHIYNLYKKINVNNRFEAAEWLSENTCSSDQRRI